MINSLFASFIAARSLQNTRPFSNLPVIARFFLLPHHRYLPSATVNRRSYHHENTNPEDINSMPFEYSNPYTFALKFGSFVAFALSIPILLVWKHSD